MGVAVVAGCGNFEQQTDPYNLIYGEAVIREVTLGAGSEVGNPTQHDQAIYSQCDLNEAKCGTRSERESERGGLGHL